MKGLELQKKKGAKYLDNLEKLNVMDKGGTLYLKGAD